METDGGEELNCLTRCKEGEVYTLLDVYSCHNKSPQAGWFKTIEIYSSKVIETKVGNQGVWIPQWKNYLMLFSWLLVVGKLWCYLTYIVHCSKGYLHLHTSFSLRLCLSFCVIVILFCFVSQKTFSLDLKPTLIQCDPKLILHFYMGKNPVSKCS